MRKLKLQMQLSIDGFVCGPQGEMDWLTWDWDEPLKEYVKVLTAPVDCIVMGHHLAQGFIPHWQGLVIDPQTADEFGKKMVDTRKIIFSRNPAAAQQNLETASWKNAQIAQGTLTDEILALKQKTGGDIIVYGGAEFVGELIKANLIDEYHLFVNPAAIGKGMGIFNRVEKSVPFQFEASEKFDCGVVVLRYRKS